MVVYKYGDPEANIVLIQPVGDHDVHDIENDTFFFYGKVLEK